MHIFLILISYLSFSKVTLANTVYNFLLVDLTPIVVVATFLPLYAGTLTSLLLSIYSLPLCSIHSDRLLINTVNGFLTIGFVLIVIIATFLSSIVNTLTSSLLLSYPYYFPLSIPLDIMTTRSSLLVYLSINHRILDIYLKNFFSISQYLYLFLRIILE